MFGVIRGMRSRVDARPSGSVYWSGQSSRQSRRTAVQPATAVRRCRSDGHKRKDQGIHQRYPGEADTQVTFEEFKRRFPNNLRFSANDCRRSRALWTMASWIWCQPFRSTWTSATWVRKCMPHTPAHRRSQIYRPPTFIWTWATWSIWYLRRAFGQQEKVQWPGKQCASDDRLPERLCELTEDERQRYAGREEEISALWHVILAESVPAVKELLRR